MNDVFPDCCTPFPDDIPDHKECRWCGMLFVPVREGQQLCDEICADSEAGRD